MTDRLPRLKPDPIPAIHPVPEYAATGPLAEVYARTKAGLGVPWMGVVAMAFAHYPTFYRTLWAALDPLVGHARFGDACTAVQRAAEAQAANLGATKIEASLTSLGYGAREADDIRACIEIFAAGNMPYILMATVARRLLEGHRWDVGGDPGAPCMAPAAPKPPLMEPHHASAETRAHFGDIKSTLGLPFVNTDYRALARWPSYLEIAWLDLRTRVTSPGYAASVHSVHDLADALCCALPNPARVTPDQLADAARRDGPVEDILNTVRLFQWLLPGLAVNVAVLQRQMAQD